MRTMFGLIGLALLASAGCRTAGHHVGGSCDCGATTGDAHTYAPYTAAPAVAPVVPGKMDPTIAPKEMPKAPQGKTVETLKEPMKIK